MTSFSSSWAGRNVSSGFTRPAETTHMKQLTLPQKKAIVALVMLAKQSRRAGFSRWELGRASKHSCSSYPTKTMRSLQRAGLCEPVCNTALELVETGQCRCGCDLWKPSDKGKEYVGSLKVVGKVTPSRQLSDEELRRLFGGESDPQEGWQRGDAPPEFDPNSPSQRPEDSIATPSSETPADE